MPLPVGLRALGVRGRIRTDLLPRKDRFYRPAQHRHRCRPHKGAHSGQRQYERLSRDDKRCIVVFRLVLAGQNRTPGQLLTRQLLYH